MRKLLLTTLTGTLLSGAAWGGLGGDLSSVQADQQAWHATVTKTAVAGATVHSQRLPDGPIVRQYLDATGLVIAVGWEGPVLPDFERLLGPYFQAYIVAVRQQKRGVSIKTLDLVIESGGMMRSFVGRAYLPAKIPANLAPQYIR